MKFKRKFIFIFFIFFTISIVFSNFAFADTTEINSGAAILIETSTGRILYEKNAYQKMYPASTTKIMTAILTLENCKLSDVATVSASALESIPNGYVTANLQIGEQLTIKDLLYALMVKSANDTAVVLAEHISGSVENFSVLMNNKAKELGCTSTNFVNPNGIHNENHYSTAYDLSLIAKYCMKNETFRKIVSTTSYTLPATNKYENEDRTFSNTNSLIIVNNNNRADNYYYKNAIGIKTGYTSQARNCLIAGSLRDGLEFISVVLDAGLTDTGLSVRYLDTISLLDYGYNNFTLTKIKETNNVADTIEVPKATRDTKNLDLLVKDNITVVNNKTTDVNQISPEIILKENLIAPISKGDVVGTIKYVVDDTEYSSDLLAGSDVEKSDVSVILIVAGLVIIILALIIYPNIKGGKKKSKKNKNRKKKNSNDIYSVFRT
ncbi:MAG: D-alanyl-D-alanine carboxypeptidase family protein [Candidatus Scatovivens sp.]